MKQRLSHADLAGARYLALQRFARAQRRPTAEREGDNICSLEFPRAHRRLSTGGAPCRPCLGHRRFHFYSDEGIEPPHIHVDYGDGESKFWLQPVRLARAENVAPFEVRRIEREIAARQAFFVEQYHAFFNR